MKIFVSNIEMFIQVLTPKASLEKRKNKLDIYSCEECTIQLGSENCPANKHTVGKFL